MGKRMQPRQLMQSPRSAVALALFASLSSGCAGHVNDAIWRPVSDWSYLTAIGTAIHESSWLFAVIESFHLVGLALLGGAILIVDLRLLGIGIREESAAGLSRAAQPVLVGSLAVMLTSGALLYLSEATKFYSPDFWDSAEFPFIYKRLFLILAMVFTFTVRQRMLVSDEARVSPAMRRIVALTSMTLWLGVGVGGRAIGFY
jgi:Family of unknown function (DUF6644)